MEHKNKICNEKAILKNIGLFRVSWEEILKQSNHPCLEYIFLPQIIIVQKKKKKSYNIQLMVSKVCRDLGTPES